MQVPTIPPFQKRRRGSEFVSRKRPVIEAIRSIATPQAVPVLDDPLGLTGALAHETQLRLENIQQAERPHRGNSEPIGRMPSPLPIQMKPQSDPQVALTHWCLDRVTLPQVQLTRCAG